jgi:predicted Zn-dependent protease
MREEMGRVHDLVNQNQYGEAKKLAEKVAARCAYYGVQSAHAAWALAVVNDYAGEVEAAFKHISEAVRLDPLEPNIMRSFDIVVGHIRHILLDPDRDLADDSTPRLHAMLVEAGKADALVHLAMARHLAEVEKDGEAMKLVEAVLLLAPACRDAWVVKATLAKKLGLVDEAVAAEAEAAALDGGPLPLFGIPGLAVA